MGSKKGILDVYNGDGEGHAAEIEKSQSGLVKLAPFLTFTSRFEMSQLHTSYGVVPSTY